VTTVVLEDQELAARAQMVSTPLQVQLLQVKALGQRKSQLVQDRLTVLQHTMDN
jgi:hypothetical protein